MKARTDPLVGVFSAGDDQHLLGLPVVGDRATHGAGDGAVLAHYKCVDCKVGCR